MTLRDKTQPVSPGTARGAAADAAEGDGLPEKARFLRGSILRHVLVMSLTGSAGLMFMFLVDAATLFWVSRLGEESLLAALGFAWTVQFFTISVGIGLMIAATALVSRSIGQGKIEQARRQTTVAALYGLAIQTVIAALVVTFRHQILALAGAEGQTAQDAARFLAISVPSLPIMALGMVASAALRAVGDAWRAMFVTMSAGAVAMVVDPLLIFGLGLGYDGAAWGVVLSRITSAALGFWFLVSAHAMLATPTRADLRALIMPFVAIAAPAIVTQLATPMGNYLLTAVISAYGDAAVAGWAVISRLSVLAFGGLFALSGAIGGIIGQNYGAGLIDRVERTFIEALRVCVVYTLFAWAALAALRGPIVVTFGLEGVAVDVLTAFLFLGAGSFMFTGAIFVANAAFNNLGRPLYSTACNWLRDGVLTWPCCVALGAAFGAPGVIYGSGLAAFLAGVGATIWAWRFVRALPR
ncbi:MAG: MATE family efflux transporter [Pseudomonadota bacterium]